MAGLVVIQAQYDLCYSEAFADEAWDYLASDRLEYHLLISGRNWDSDRPRKMGRFAFTEWAREQLIEAGIVAHVEQLEMVL